MVSTWCRGGERLALKGLDGLFGFLLSTENPSGRFGAEHGVVRVRPRGGVRHVWATIGRHLVPLVVSSGVVTVGHCAGRGQYVVAPSLYPWLVVRRFSCRVFVSGGVGAEDLPIANE